MKQQRSDTAFAIENFIKEHDGEFRKKTLWQKQPKEMTYKNFQAILAFLLKSNKISEDAEGKIGRIYYPRSAAAWEKKPRLIEK